MPTTTEKKFYQVTVHKKRTADAGVESANHIVVCAGYGEAEKVIGEWYEENNTRGILVKVSQITDRTQDYGSVIWPG